MDPNAVSAQGPTHGEPNDAFDDALIAVLSDASTARLQGTISTSSDIDVYDLGPLSAGDRVIVDTDTMNGALDVSITLYDAEQRLFTDNDDRETDPPELDSYVEESVRHDSDHYYLAISASAFATYGSSEGSYRAEVSIERGAPTPDPKPQTLLLDFDGGEVDAEVIPVSVVRAFDAGDIARVYADDTDAIKASIIDTVRQNFARFEVDVVTSDDPAPDPPYSTVFFGGRNPIAFGISESVDHYNSDPDDVSVIFTEAFTPNVFSKTPTAEELGVAIGNIAAHEAGHILGLNHVNDPTALMDAVSPADAFLDDQEFKTAPLSEQILPLGVQDALLLLAEIVGLR